MLRVLCLGALVVGLAGSASGEEIERKPAPAEARVYFVTPLGGDEVASPVLVRFGLSGMGVAPAGVDWPNTGHHHLIVDAPTPPADRPIPADDHYRHFGGGQTEVELALLPGEHTLQLVLGDHIHVPHVPPVVSDVIRIRVK
ncbi:MAG: DUF4399 domain-containing protein [Myxococcota bacterium]